MIRCRCGHSDLVHLPTLGCWCACWGFEKPTDAPPLLRFEDGRCMLCGKDHADDTECRWPDPSPLRGITS